MPDDIQLTTTIARSGAFALFALCAYGAMLVLAGCALTIGILTFADVCRPEATLIGALAAIAFALPVLRNAMPGSPPLGVSADMWVFLWTELAVVLALVLMVFKWARTGLQPLRSERYRLHRSGLPASQRTLGRIRHSFVGRRRGDASLPRRLGVGGRIGHRISKALLDFLLKFRDVGDAFIDTISRQ